jgi:hypothetical protein
VKSSENIELLSAALVATQAIIENPEKNATNPAFRSKYVNLTGVLEVVRPALAENGLAVVQGVGLDEGRVVVTTRLIHSSGQWLEPGTASAPLRNQDAQGVGSAVTYLRRYSLLAALGIAPEDDDDGNAARDRREPQGKAALEQAKAQGLKPGSSVEQPTKASNSLRQIEADQMEHLAALLGECGFSTSANDKVQGRQFICWLANVDFVDDIRTLTWGNAAKAIARLEAARAKGELEALVFQFTDVAATR